MTSKGDIRTFYWGLAGSFVAIVLVLATVGVWIYRKETEQIRRERWNALHAVGDLKVRQLVGWRNERLADVRVNATRVSLRQAVEEILTSGGSPSAKDLLQSRLQTISEAYGYQNVIIAGADGRVLFSLLPKLTELEASARKLVADAVAARGAIFGDFFRCPIDQEVHLDVAAPILDETSRPIAVLIFRSDPNKDLYPLIQSWPTPSRTAETLLVRREGDEVVYLNALRHTTAPALTLRIPLARKEVPAVQAVLGRTGEFEGTDYRGIKVVSSLWQVPGSPWFMVAKVDAGEILAEAYYRGRLIALLAGLTILMTAIAAAFLGSVRRVQIFKSLYRAERERREAQEEVRATLYSIGDAVIVTDTAGRIRRLNRVAARLTGWSEAEATGKPLTEVFRIINEQTRAEVESPVVRVSREGVVIGLANHTLLLSRDGREYPIADSGAPIRSEDGEVLGVVLVFRDQTDERAAQKEILARASQQAVVAELGRLALRGDLSALHDQTVRRVAEVLGVELCKILELQPDGQRLLLRAGVGWNEGLVGSATVPAGLESQAGYTLKYGEPVIVEDLRTEKRFSGPPLLHDHGVVSGMSVVVAGREKPYGVLGAHTRTHRLFTKEDVYFLQSVGNLLAEAIAHKQVEDQLRDSLERYYLLFHGSLDAVLLTIPDGRILDANAAACRMFGYTVEELVAGGRALVVDATDPRLAAALEERARTGRFHGELTLVRKDGTKFPAEISASLFTDHEGQVRCSLVIRDISERKQAEEALRESRERLQSIFRVAPIGVGLVRNRIWLEANTRICEMLGYSAEELVGQSTRILYATSEEFDYVGQTVYRQIAETGTGLMETRWRRKDGTILHVFLAMTPLRAGDVSGEIVITVLDITDRKRAETALRLSEERLRLAVASAHQGIYDVDILTGEVTVNDEYALMLGYDPATFHETNAGWIERLHPEDREVVVPIYQAYIAGKLPDYRVEFRLRTASGGYKWILSQGEIVEWDADGRPLRMLGTHTDITERRQMEEQLRQALKMEAIGQLAGGVAHDFNNMLQAILGHTQLALDQVGNNPPLLESLMEIQKAAQRSADLTGQLLAFARKQTIAPRILDLNETIGSMFKMLSRLIGENILLEWKPAPQLWPVKVDPAQLNQILVNLSVNARDAIAGSGTVTIETANVTLDENYCAAHAGFVPGDYVVLAVSDTGVGMDKATLERIFEPFFTTKGVGKGTGMGLSIVYGMVKQNHGFINVYSEPGRGSTFKIYLPRVAEEVKPEPEVAVAPEVLHGTETVLIVEDEETILNLGRTILEHYGYTVLTARRPTDALALAREHAGEIHLLITDVVMPQMNGRELREKIEAIRPQIKTLFMSGYTANAIAHHGVLDEDVEFLQKPFTVQMMAEKVRTVLDRKKPSEE
ncbi:MAG: PAS domain S-box protein [Candidatus Sumerlaeia bacterium]|nr:PAS domain S-box protein [Candidatus Sumerlaeia bacterium]